MECISVLLESWRRYKHSSKHADSVIRVAFLHAPERFENITKNPMINIRLLIPKDPTINSR